MALDAESLLLAEVKKNSELLSCMQKEMHDLRLDVRDRLHDQDKRILAHETKSSFYGVVGGLLGLVGLKFLESYFKVKT